MTRFDAVHDGLRCFMSQVHVRSHLGTHDTCKETCHAMKIPKSQLLQFEWTLQSLGTICKTQFKILYVIYKQWTMSKEF